jgi:hypothetical protein
MKNDPRPTSLFRATALAAAVACAAALPAGPTAAGPADPSVEPPCAADRADGPRTLVLALDGVALRLVERAREQGAFAGWPAPIPMVSTFPSVTNVSFTAMFAPFGIPRALGYEIQHFDRELNEVVGASVVDYENQVYAWRDMFDVTPRTFSSKLAGYTRPKKKALSELEHARETLFSLERDLVLVHVGGTDSLMHLRGEKKVIAFLIELDAFVERLRAEHLERTGRPLRVVLLSDHGNTSGKIYAAPGIRRSLRRADFNVVDELNVPDDVVAATFGLVSYGALFLADAGRAEDAAVAVAGVKAVDVAGWISGPGEVTVVSGDGEARIRWRDEAGGRGYAYEPRTADVLRLIEVRDRLEASGRLDPTGFATQDDWLAESARAEFPDALDRMTRALDGSFVSNTANVLFSVRPGYAWGWRSAHASSWLQGGRLEGTHGGLDRDSSLGFFMADGPQLMPSAPALRAVAALGEFKEFGSCFAAVRKAGGATRADGAHAAGD